MLESTNFSAAPLKNRLIVVFSWLAPAVENSSKAKRLFGKITEKPPTKIDCIDSTFLNISPIIAALQTNEA